jgi:hypothetical protein
MIKQGQDYLKELIKPVGQYGTDSFAEACWQIKVLPEHWLPFLEEGYIANLLGPLTVNAPVKRQ